MGGLQGACELGLGKITRLFLLNYNWKLVLHLIMNVDDVCIYIYIYIYIYYFIHSNTFFSEKGSVNLTRFS